MLKTIDVVAAIIQSGTQILLARRPVTGDQPGLWEFPGGKVEAGESQPQALIRELTEELGITAHPTVWVASHQREVSGRMIHLHAWHVPHFTGTPVNHCHSGFVWCTPQEALTYDLAPADIPLLQAFITRQEDVTP